MAKARAIVKRRKAVRNIKKITKTMQMIATAKFQKSLKRAVGSKPYTLKLREVASEVVKGAGEITHPLLRQPGELKAGSRVAIIVITSNRGLCGAYNGHVLRAGYAFVKQHIGKGCQIDLYSAGKKGGSFFKFQKVPIARAVVVSDPPKYAEINDLSEELMKQFSDGVLDAVFVAFMNFISTGLQKPAVNALLPITGIKDVAESLARETAEKAAQAAAGVMDTTRRGENVQVEEIEHAKSIYEFSPSAADLVGELLPLAVKTALFQAFLDAATSEHVARMVAMKSATDNADKMQKALSLQYNRARQSQITTELSEIMGGVEAMK
ncbi:MAG TPA: ATP synthase F1 subunit gamma [Tepidisphaeraceae bacterium]|nr:ATP synthase F1 subunit gamma [Tepidisphaeraceae bacterium]